MRALLVGAGRMGAFHRRVLRDLGCDVTTVDPNPAAGADHLRVPPGQFEVVCIAAPIAHLAEEAYRWVGFEGHLLIEKPGAPTLADATYLADLMRGQRVAVGYVERFNPQVRHLRALLTRAPGASRARFIRWNDRPSPDVELDLRSHDIDLARFLGLDCPVEFDARADSPVRRRLIEVTAGLIKVTAGDRRLTVDLTAHDTSPLHAMWHAFLANRPALGYATLEDAVGVLTEVEHRGLRMAA